MRGPAKRSGSELSPWAVSAYWNVGGCRLASRMDLQRHAGGLVEGEPAWKGQPLAGFPGRVRTGGDAQADGPLGCVVTPGDGYSIGPTRRYGQRRLTPNVDEQPGLGEETMWVCAISPADLKC